MAKQIIRLSEFHPYADGKTNDFTAFLKCFERAKDEESIIVIEAGKYLIDGEYSIPLYTNLTVVATDAEFIFPRALGDKHHRVMFCGKNISNFTWTGGLFRGFVYNPVQSMTLWEPSANTKCIEIVRTPDGESKNIRVEKVHSVDVGGAVVHISGTFEEDTWKRYPVYNVDINGCTFENSGKFMWDYGYLWQRIVFPEFHSESEVLNAYKYMPVELMSGEVSFSHKNSEICVDNMPEGIERESDTVCFFGNVPRELKKGCCYYIRSLRKSGTITYITVSETPNGMPISSFSESGKCCRLFRNLYTVHHEMYCPKGAGLGKGPMDLSVCDSVKVIDCRMNASGDSMHIDKSYNVIVSGNHITGSRMGAFYIAQYCKNVTVTANTVLGTNGSRVLSVERSTEDISIVGNTFSGGGRGVWINQPYNIIMSDNIFSLNTNKCTPNPHIGRLTPNSGKYEYYPEIYFTTWQKNANYGAVIMRSNIIKTSPYCSAAVAFHDGGKEIVFESNVIQGEKRDIYVGKCCEMPHMSGNIGIGNVIDELHEEKFDQKVQD